MGFTKECEATRHLLALRPDEWGSDERRQVETHLRLCSDCAALADIYAEQDRLICAAPRVGLTPLQRAQLRSRIQRADRHRRMDTQPRVLAGIATATVVLILLSVGLSPFFRQSDQASDVAPPTPARISALGPTSSPTLVPSPPAKESVAPTVTLLPSATPAPQQEGSGPAPVTVLPGATPSSQPQGSPAPTATLFPALTLSPELRQSTTTAAALPLTLTPTSGADQATATAPSPSPTPLSQREQPTTTTATLPSRFQGSLVDGWRTYTNTAYEFSFSHPANWTLEESSSLVNLHREALV